MLDELEASRASRNRAWENLQGLRWRTHRQTRQNRVLVRSNAAGKGGYRGPGSTTSGGSNGFGGTNSTYQWDNRRECSKSYANKL
jgi:hypothetical protein